MFWAHSRKGFNCTFMELKFVTENIPLKDGML